MEPFKNAFSPELVAHIADELERLVDDLDRSTFEQPVLAQLETLELKARAQLIADQLFAVLPDEIGRRHAILADMLAAPGAGETELGQPQSEGVSGWGVMPLSMVVGQHGRDDFEGSLALLAEMTTRFSSEFAVRYLLADDLHRALETVSTWVDDPSEHVRRLASEGTRPRLPWAMRLNDLVADPSPTLPILEALRDDPSPYVRRSVANHLNDIAKDHPALVADIARDWMIAASSERRRLLRHACRTLIKAGDPEVLSTFGFHPPEVGLESLWVTTPVVKLGDTLDFEARIRSTADHAQQLSIDFVVQHRKANGRLTPKVFKWTTTTLEGGATRELKRSHPMKPITTRRYHPGEHRLSLRINGVDLGDEMFVLSID